MYYNDNERNVWYYNHLILLIYMTNKNFLTFSFKNYIVIKFVVLITIWLGQHNFFNEKVRKFLSVTYQQIMVARTKTFLSVTTRIHYRFCGQVLCTDCNYSRNFHVNIVKIIIPFGRREHSTRKNMRMSIFAYPASKSKQRCLIRKDLALWTFADQTATINFHHQLTSSELVRQV